MAAISKSRGLMIFLNKYFVALSITLFLVFSSAAQKTKNTLPGTSKSTSAAIASLEKDIPELMKLADVPGLSAVLIRNGKIVWSKGFGVQNAETKEAVTNETVFEAASLSKVVFAYGVLKLVDQGKLDLDTPLNKYLGTNYEVGDADARINLITARRVLTHTSGFPNWRAPDAKTLPIEFTPGEKFSYSGEGFVYLSAVVEKITGMPLEDFMQTTVLKPLGMTNSSFMWQDKYRRTGAYRHDLLGNKLFRNQGKAVNAAASLRTTADDYARLIAALLNGTGLQKKTWKAMLTPQIGVNEKSPEVFWGLGVGLEKTGEGRSFWHWGDQGDTKAYFTAFLPRKDAIVYFANSPNGLSITKEILDDALGGKHPAVAYLDYGSYADDSSRILLKAVIAKGAAEALEDYRKQRRQTGATLAEFRVNRIGYALLQLKKIDDAIAVFTRTRSIFRIPQTSGTALPKPI